MAAERKADATTMGPRAFRSMTEVEEAFFPEEAQRRREASESPGEFGRRMAQEAIEHWQGMVSVRP